MHVLVDFCIVPMGVSASVSDYIVTCERIIQESGLKWNLHATGTNLEGEWHDVFQVIRRCHEALHMEGVPRLTTSVHIDTRTDKDQSIEQEIRAVEEKLDEVGVS